jgi:hypothetical protein
MAWVPNDWEDEPRPSRGARGSLGHFVEHLVCNPKIKGLKILLKIKPTPCKKCKNQHKIQGAQSVSGFVPLNEQKKEEKWGFREVWVTVRRNKNGGMGRIGGPTKALWRRGDVSVVVGRCLGGGIIGRREEGCTAVGVKMKGEKGKGDLKGSHEMPKMHVIERTRCVRSHSC